MHILLLYILKYAGGGFQISSKIAENMIDEYSYWMVICFFCIKEIV